MAIPIKSEIIPEIYQQKLLILERILPNKQKEKNAKSENQLIKSINIQGHIWHTKGQTARKNRITPRLEIMWNHFVLEAISKTLP